MRAPDAIEPLIGWRYWHTSSGRGLMPAGSSGSAWPPRRTERARCRPIPGSGIAPCGGESTPTEGCTCGFHAYKNLGYIFWSVTELGFKKGLVIGEVHLWGKVALAKHGFRAEFAYPRSLIVVPGSDVRPEQRASLELTYGVPVTVMTASELQETAEPVQISSIRELMGRGY